VFARPARQTQPRSRYAFGVLAVALGACLVACQGLSGSRAPAADPNATEEPVPAVAAPPPEFLAPGDEVELFDGQSLGMWKPDSIGDDASVRVEQGAIQLNWGRPGTSLAWTGMSVPANYELALEVMRLEGSGSGYWFLTFPIDADRSCTLTLANGLGWLCGASGPVGDGAFTRAVGLDGGAWHSVRLRVIRGRIEAFLDGEELVVEPAAASTTALSEESTSASLEIATWAMTAAVREIRLKRLPDTAR
jgi:hypothetical protein